MLRTITLATFVINVIIFGALSFSYWYAAKKMNTPVIYSLACLFSAITLSEIIGVTSFITISYTLSIIAKLLTIATAGAFLVYSYKKQGVLK